MGLDSNSSGSNDNKNGVRFQDYLNSNQPESIIYCLIIRYGLQDAVVKQVADTIQEQPW
jgi:hypothetical protein